jgi:hypothetical protein
MRIDALSSNCSSRAPSATEKFGWRASNANLDHQVVAALSHWRESALIPLSKNGDAFYQTQCGLKGVTFVMDIRYTRGL